MGYRQPLDPRLIPPNKIPVVKVDNLYQLKREDIHNYQLIDRPFVTAINGERIPCSTWDFMSIYTDGVFNQDNTARLPPTGDSVCCIEFNDQEIYILKAETITPIPIVKKQWFRLWNELGGNQSDSEGLETGFGNFKILLHNFPYQWQIGKKNPHFCNTDPIEYEEIVTFWAGINKTSALYDTVVPYLPPNYGCLRICWYAEDPLIELSVQHLCCIDGTLGCRLDEFTTGTGCFTIPSCSQRVQFTIVNNKEGDPIDYCLDVKWLEGCWSCCEVPA